MRAVPTKLCAAVIGALMTALGAAAPASAKTPAADCQPYGGQGVSAPVSRQPADHADKASVTGLRVNLPSVGDAGQHQGRPVKPGTLNGSDGFSPGSTLVIHIPGLDSAAALKRTGAVPLTDMSRYLAKRQPIVVIDQATGKRQLIWAEMDANADGQRRTPTC